MNVENLNNKKMKFLIIDNYDSFTYNIAQYLGKLQVQCIVIRNDVLTIDVIRQEKYDAIIISPGAGKPSSTKDFGICNDVIKILGKHTPILGICLGHQGIINVFGGKITHAKYIMHGKKSGIKHDNSILFKNISNPFIAARYHSLVGSKEIPTVLTVNAVSIDDHEIMAVTHKQYPIYGIQFHPESVGTDQGINILSNFINIVNIFNDKTY